MSDSTDTSHSSSSLGQAVDELKLQAWLGRAEFMHPSMKTTETREEVNKLAAMRDSLRVQAHLGRMEAEDDWHELEDRWRKVKHQASGAVEDAVEDAGETLAELLSGIREGYQKLTGSKKSDD